jgi:2-oxoisovalerate dehydrogenase E1 component
MEFNKSGYTPDELLGLYDALVLPRMIEEKMLILLRQGKVSKWFSGIGQEAIAVGVTQALHADEYIMPLHRNLGVFTGRNMPLNTLFAQLQGKGSGFSKGRERSFHFGSNAHHIVGMISHLGPQLAIADGIALAHKLAGEGKVAVGFSGDGGTSEGDFHEALNVAAVWELPVIFVIENNGYGLSTPSNEQFRCKQFIDKGIGYGMEAVQVDGNNLLEVHRTVKALAESMRQNPRPVLLECLTFRMRGHEEASGVKYVPKELLETWAQKDPVSNFEQWLEGEGVLQADEKARIRAKHQAAIDAALQEVFAEPEIVPVLEPELRDVYAPHQQVVVAATGASRELRLVDAISDGLRQAMEQHPNLVLMGQDIAEYGGVFKITQGFVEAFGKDRVRNTPLCESAIVGSALGLSVKGYKAMMEMQFADFVTVGFNQIVNNLAKMHYRWGQHADVVVRMPTGAGVGAGPFHSQSNEAWFFHTPGLKIVYPSNPADAKGLLLAAFEDPNPYLFFEHKAMYRSISGPVPEAYYTVEVGKAAVVREGAEATIITYGMGVHWALEAVAEMGASVEIIDLRTLLPWDRATVLQSVRKTGKAFVLHEDTLTGGIGAEIAAVIAEEAFQWLDAPVMRHGALDTPVPFAVPLEQQFLGVDRFKMQLNRLLSF